MACGEVRVYDMDATVPDIGLLKKHELKALQHKVCMELKRRYVRSGPPKYGSLSKAVSDDEVRLLLAATTGRRARLIFLLQHFLGLRIGEACSLRAKDVDLSQRRIWIGNTEKGSAPALYWLHDVLFAEMSLWMSDTAAAIAASGYVFPSHEIGGSRSKFPHASPLWAAKEFRLARERAGLTMVYGQSDESHYGRTPRRLHRVTSHSFRHGFITGVAKANAGDIEVTRKLARHINVQHTLRYIKTSQEELDQGLRNLYDRTVELRRLSER